MGKQGRWHRVKLRRAVDEDLEVILRLRREAADWLAGQGSDQWRRAYPSLEGMVGRICASIDAAETWMVDEDNGKTLGTITVNQSSDDGLWTPEELGSALIVHRMILDRAAMDRGIGADLLDVAGEVAESQSRAWIRLDCWTTNQELHRYYQGQGFRHVRSVPGHYSGSAACFERPADVRHGQSRFSRDAAGIKDASA